MREAAAGLLLAVPFVVGLVSAPAAADRDVVTTLQDPEINESSGLVVDGDLAVTVNDSGDGARIFTVDLGTGETTGVTTWSADPVDDEALAPAGEGEAWVGDIGNNARDRSTVEVTRVPYGRGDRDVAGTTYQLTWPRQAYDAEALLAHPRTGRLYLISKEVLGGSLYAAPKTLRAEEPNRLHRVRGGLPGLVTDAAFFPDGRHLIARNYGQATVYTFPGLEALGTFDLPRQQQGEGIAVASDGTIYLSSEGSRAQLLRVRLPAEVETAMAPADPSDAASGGASAGDGSGGAGSEEGAPDPWPWVVGGLLGVGALVVLVRSLRPR